MIAGLEIIYVRNLECSTCSMKDSACLSVDFPESRRLGQSLESKKFVGNEISGGRGEGA